jgi:hypothetical protein
VGVGQSWSSEVHDKAVCRLVREPDDRSTFSSNLQGEAPDNNNTASIIVAAHELSIASA